MEIITDKTLVITSAMGRNPLTGIGIGVGWLCQAFDMLLLVGGLRLMLPSLVEADAAKAEPGPPHIPNSKLSPTHLNPACCWGAGLRLRSGVRTRGGCRPKRRHGPAP